jgi:CRP-like cAMP-binding protein
MNKFVEALNAMQEMSSELTNMIYKSLTEIDVEVKEYLLKSGQVPSYIYFVKKGLFEGYHKEDERLKYFGFWTNDCIIYDPLRLWNRTTTDEFIVAREPSKAYALPYASLLDIQKLFPAFNFHLGRLMEYKISELENRAKILGITDPDIRYLKFIEHFKRGFYNIPNVHIASFLGISETSLYAIFNRLKPHKKRPGENGICVSLWDESGAG